MVITEEKATDKESDGENVIIKQGKSDGSTEDKGQAKHAAQTPVVNTALETKVKTSIIEEPAIQISDKQMDENNENVFVDSPTGSVEGGSSMTDKPTVSNLELLPHTVLTVDYWDVTPTVPSVTKLLE